MFRRTAALALVAAAAPACIPYTVGTTAQPVAPGSSTTAMMMYVQPSINYDTANHSPFNARSGLVVDGEYRYGVDDKSDVGLRVIGLSGLVLNYKRLLSDTASALRFAVMPGAGIVNGGAHAYGEFTFIVSGHEPPSGIRSGTGVPQVLIVPYAGFRVSQVAPIAENAVHDQPTYGGFVGVRFGTTQFGVSPEIGVFHDHSALGVRRRDVVFVPAVVLHGNELIGVFRRLPRTFMGADPRTTPRPSRGAGNAGPDVPILPPILTPPYRPAVTSAPVSPSRSCSARPLECIVTRRPSAVPRQRP
ncbi:MAG TPA: hypothetical protein VF483_06450 [Gemmatimonadaceae bacterium]